MSCSENLFAADALHTLEMAETEVQSVVVAV